MDVVQFVDQIGAAPTVRLSLNNESPWAVTGVDFSPPPLKQAWSGTLLADGERLAAAAYANRRLKLSLELITASQDASAAALQALWVELNRPSNLLRYQPDGASQPVFFRTLRSMDNSVRDYPGGSGSLRTVDVEITAEPFALGLRETLPAVTVYNDPAEGPTLNANPYFETDAAGWVASPSGTVARSTAQAREGVASLLVTPDGTSGSAGAIAEQVTVTAGLPFRASAWVRCAVARAVGLDHAWYNAGGEFISINTTTVSVAANTWTLIDATFTAPAGAGRAAMRLTMGSTPPTSHLLYIDEARIRPAGGAGGMCFDVNAPKGDVETPLYLSVRASDVARVPESGGSGRRQSAFAVRRGGTPSAAPVVLQAESMEAGTDTTVQAASGSSGTFLRSTFATATSLQVRADTTSMFPSTPSGDARGTYRTFVRCRKSVAGDTIQLQMQYVNAGTYVTSDLVAGPADTVWRWVDMGLVQMPLGYDPGTDGLSGAPLPVGGMAVNLYAARTSGSGTLDLDVVMFLPADDRLSLVKWPDSYTSETAYVVDSVAGQAYGVGAAGEVRASLLELIGGPPLVTPGAPNRIWMLRDVGSTWSAGDDVTASVQVTVHYWPRYLHVRPVAS